MNGKWSRRAILAVAPVVACQTKQSRQQRLAELHKTLKLATEQAKKTGDCSGAMISTLEMLSRFCEAPRGNVSYGQERIYGHGMIQAHVTIEVPDPSRPWES
jgi:hypothetical protein